MKYVYLIRSISNPERRYIGITSNVENRINEHNSGKSFHTSKFKPWKLIAYVAFENHKTAIEFERYLKTGSGIAFANRHLWWA
ncbi:MAG: GIY-YIG nuclease family protein [Nitrospirae bacterium]|nr:MAG: GIY-YIG nuclease family protein [Nitrospirota bacterium]